jgi:hypothetical protein
MVSVRPFGDNAGGQTGVKIKQVFTPVHETTLLWRKLHPKFSCFSMRVQTCCTGLPPRLPIKEIPGEPGFLSAASDGHCHTPRDRNLNYTIWTLYAESVGFPVNVTLLWGTPTPIYQATWDAPTPIINLSSALVRALSNLSSKLGSAHSNLSTTWGACSQTTWSSPSPICQATWGAPSPIYQTSWGAPFLICQAIWGACTFLPIKQYAQNLK